jgi:hypothetical protein
VALIDAWPTDSLNPVVSREVGTYERALAAYQAKAKAYNAQAAEYNLWVDAANKAGGNPTRPVGEPVVLDEWGTTYQPTEPWPAPPLGARPTLPKNPLQGLTQQQILDAATPAPTAADELRTGDGMINTMLSAKPRR